MIRAAIHASMIVGGMASLIFAMFTLSFHTDWGVGPSERYISTGLIFALFGAWLWAIHNNEFHPKIVNRKPEVKE